MPDTPPSGLPPAAEPPAGPTGLSPAPGPPPPLMPRPPRAPPRASRVPTFTALVSLVIALAAIGVAIAAWLRPMPEHNAPPPSAPTYTEQEIADAKGDVCGAYKVVKNEVRVNTYRPDLQGDEVGSLASAAMKRLAIFAGGNYLLDRLVAEPATPAELAKSIRSLANSYEEFGIRALNNEPDSGLDPIRRAVDAELAVIDRLCK